MMLHPQAVEERPREDRRAHPLAELAQRLPEGGGPGDRHQRPEEDHQGRIPARRGRVDRTVYLLGALDIDRSG